MKTITKQFSLVRTISAVTSILVLVGLVRSRWGEPMIFQWALLWFVLHLIAAGLAGVLVGKYVIQLIAVPIRDLLNREFPVTKTQ